MYIMWVSQKLPQVSGKDTLTSRQAGVESEEAEHRCERWPGMLLVPSPASCSARGEAGSGPDGDADDGGWEVCEAGLKLCQLLLILCSMVRC